MVDAGLGNSIFAAMGQSFFTVSIGIGALAIFGSYIGKEHRLTGEAISITILDTLVAFMAGLIIFPACFAYGVEPTSGPSLIFITLPNVFNHMAGGRLWGSLFFVFMSFAALSTVIAVFQNIISFATDLTGCSVKKAVAWNVAVVIILSLPCVFGFNIWSNFQPLGAGSNIQDLRTLSSVITCCLLEVFCICCSAPAVMDGALKSSWQKQMRDLALSSQDGHVLRKLHPSADRDLYPGSGIYCKILLNKF